MERALLEPSHEPLPGVVYFVVDEGRTATALASLRVHGEKMELTTIPDNEWSQVENAAEAFWEEIAGESEVKRKVVDIFKRYNADMRKAGRPYRYDTSA